MPLLDVSMVLLDPMFLDTSGTYTRATQTVDAHGRAANTSVTAELYAVYTNKDGSILQRLAEGERVTDTVLVHTPTKLTAGGTDTPADVITWDGAQYTVTNVANYSTYGAGFVMATAEILPLDGGPL